MPLFGPDIANETIQVLKQDLRPFHSLPNLLASREPVMIPTMDDALLVPGAYDLHLRRSLGLILN